MTRIILLLVGPAVVALLLWVALSAPRHWVRPVVIWALLGIILTSSVVFFDVYARARFGDADKGHITREHAAGIREMLDATSFGRLQIICAAVALTILALKRRPRQ